MGVNTKMRKSISQFPGAQEFIKNLTQHEVGHYIAARVYSFKTGEINLKLTDGLGGYIGSVDIELYKPLDSTSSIIKYLEERIVILFAGVLSEHMYKGKVDIAAADKFLKITAENDFSKIRELLHLLNSISTSKEKNIQDELNKIYNNLWEKAIALVENEFELIEGIAEGFTSLIKEIGTQYTVSEEDLEKIQNLKNVFLIVNNF